MKFCKVAMKLNKAPRNLPNTLSHAETAPLKTLSYQPLVGRRRSRYNDRLASRPV